MTVLELIQTLFNNDINRPVELPEGRGTRLARALEAQLQEDIKPLLDQYLDGYMSTGEFYKKLTLICNEEVKLD